VTANDLLGLAFYGPIALGFALGLVLVQGAVLAIEHRYARWTLAAVPAAICLGIALSTLLSGRNLRYAALDIGSIGAGSGGAGNILRGLTAVVLALCFAKILSTLMRQAGAAQTSPGGRHLLASLLAVFVATHGLSAAFGTHPAFVHNSYYPIAVFVAFFMARDTAPEHFVESLKISLLALVVGSILLAAVWPSLALQPDYASPIPGLRVRLWGLGAHANGIGPLALLAALMLHLRPFRARWLQYFAWAAVLTVLLLAQSKTVWAVAVACAVLLAGYESGWDEKGRLKPGYLLAVLLAIVLVVLAVMAADLGRVVGKLSASKAGGELATLTGRTTIWLEAWRTWMENFWFGYGPEAWGPLHRAHIGMPFAFHAHNQLMQSVSSAGLFGGLTMLVYLACMLVASWRAARLTRGVSLALALVVLARAMTEAPLEVDGLFTGEMLVHLTWFALVLRPYSDESRRSGTVDQLPDASVLQTRVPA
jgi:O-antigen ligase